MSPISLQAPDLHIDVTNADSHTAIRTHPGAWNLQVVSVWYSKDTFSVESCFNIQKFLSFLFPSLSISLLYEPKMSISFYRTLLSCRVSSVTFLCLIHAISVWLYWALLFNSVQLSRCLVHPFNLSLSVATYQYATVTASSEQVFLLTPVRSWLERETLQHWVAKMVSFLHTSHPSSLAFSIWSSICNLSSIRYHIIHQQ